MYNREKKDSSMKENELKPHKWAKEIIAWANGAKIERKDSTILNSKWNITTNPAWDNSYWEFRVYDPLREVKEAFKAGKVIQYRNTNIDDNPDWIDWECEHGGSPAWSLQPEWRIKPDNELEIGKDYIHVYGDCLVIDRVGDDGNSGFTLYGRQVATNFRCSNPKNWQEATSEEVKGFFEKHLIIRYGEDWKNVKIKDSMYECGACLNEGIFEVDIDKYNEVWKIWNKNGCLFNGKEWAEVLDEEIQYIPFEVEDKEQFRGKWIKRKDGNLEMKITRFETLSTNTFLIERRSPKQLLEDFTFIDGTPFGKIKQ